MGDERYRLVDQQLEELLLVVLDDWESVMITGEYVPSIPVDELLVESLGLTKACDILQVYSQLQRFCYPFPTHLSLTTTRGEIDSGRGHGK